MGTWYKTEKAPEYEGVDLDTVILDTYINKHKSPKLDMDYIDKISNELNIAPYDIGRVLGYNPFGLSTHIPNRDSLVEKSRANKNVDFANEWIDEPMSQEDFDLFNSLVPLGGSTKQQEIDAWNKMREAGFDLPDYDKNLHYGLSRDMRSANLYKYKRGGGTVSRPIRRIK